MSESSSRTPKSARNPGGRSRAARPRRRRWLLLPLALGAAAAAFYVLLAGRAGGPDSAGAALDEIGDASRQSLERVILEADRAEGAAR